MELNELLYVQPIDDATAEKLTGGLHAAFEAEFATFNSRLDTATDNLFRRKLRVSDPSNLAGVSINIFIK